MIDLGTTTLLAGDADGDNDADNRDLQLFQRGLNQAPRPGTFTDVNDDGITGIDDMSYAGRNIGNRGLVPVLAPAGMVSWWPGDGNALDIVDGNDGALQNGAAFAPGYVGQTFRFDGVDDRVQVPDAPNLGGMSQLTIDAWILPDGNGGPPVVAPGLVTKWGPTPGAADDSYFLRLTSDGRLWGAIQGSGRVDLIGNEPISDYQWALVAMVYDGSELRLYVNGALDASTPAVVGPINNGTFPLLIGRNDDSQNPGTFFGLIDEVELFDRALSEAELTALFNARTAGKVKPPPPEPVEPPAGMVSWWPGDGNAQDIVGGNDGILSGDASFAPGKVGDAFTLDGTGDFVLVPDSPNLNITGDVTVDLWAKRTVFGRTSVLVDKGANLVDSVDQPDAYAMWFSPNDLLVAGFARADGSLVFLVGPVVTDSQFHHYAYVRSGSTHKLFMDGVVVAADAFTGVPGDTSGLPLAIGAVRRDPTPPGFASEFGGIIDEVEIFNRALSEAEIRSIFDAGPAGKIKPPPGPVEPPAGMVSWWPGDGDTRDIIGDNDGALSGDASFASGKVGDAFSLDGTGDFVEIPHNASLNLPQFSVDAWVFIDPVVNAGQFNAFVGKSNGSTVGGGFWLAHDARNEAGFPVTEDALHFTVNGGPSGASDAFLKNSVPESGFYHLTGTFDGSQARLYVNGSLVDTGPAIPGVTFNTFPLRIGAINLKERTGIDDRFEGIIDEVELFDRALSEAEIRSIFHAGSAGKIKPPPGPVEPPAGMVSWWPGDGNARDIVNGNDGALSGDATFAPGKVGQAFSFDGTGDFVEIPHNASLNLAQFSIDAWAFIDPAVNGGQVNAIAGKSNGAGGGGGFWLLHDDRRLPGAIDVTTNALRFTVLGGPNISSDASLKNAVLEAGFYHLAGTFDGSWARLYINGTLVTTGAPIAGILFNTLPLRIGSMKDIGFGSNDRFEGLIDEVELFDRALSEAEIWAIFHAGPAGKRKPPQPVEPPAGMVSWWPGDGHTLDIVDGNDGVLSGNATFAPGMVGQAFSLDGTGDVVIVPGSPNLNITGDVTVDLWAKRSVVSTGVTSQLIAKGAGAIGITDAPTVYSLQFDPADRILAVFERTDASNVVLTGPAVTDADFHHYAYVRSGDTHTLFMDGSPVASDSFTGSPGDTSGIELGIGAIRHDSAPTGFTQHFGGVIDEVEIFNRALSEAEIRGIFKAGREGKIKPPPVAIRPPAGLISWWPGDGNALDIMDGNDGTIFNGVTFAPGRVGQAFDFDGANRAVILSNNASLNPTTAFTVDAWVKPDDFTGGHGGAGFIIASGRDCCGSSDGGIGLHLATSQAPVAYFWRPDNSQVAVRGTAMSANSWHLVAMTFDGTSLRVYQDGVLTNSATFAATTVKPGSRNLQIGRHPDCLVSVCFPFHGLIDEVELFNRALTGQEIKAIFLAGPEGKIKEPLNPLNGHFYQAISVPGGINWSDAKAAAESLSLAGVQGHLATITSQQENDFIIANFPSAIKSFGYWLGGLQPPGSPEPGGNWQWVTGEPFVFVNWAPGEPNNADAGEDKIHFHSATGLWNDLGGNDTRPDGYIVEYAPAPVINFSGQRAQAGSFNVLQAVLPDVAGIKTQGVKAHDRNGPQEPFTASIAYLKMAGPQPTVAPYAMTSTGHLGFASLAAFGTTGVSFDQQGSNMLAGNIIHNEAGAPMSLDDPLFNVLDNVVYFVETGIGRNMEKRTYQGGTWSMIDNGGTPNGATGDAIIATGTIGHITLFLDYTTFLNSGRGVISVNPGSAFHDELVAKFGTTDLELTVNAFQSPVFRDDPVSVPIFSVEGYAVFESSISVTPAQP